MVARCYHHFLSKFIYFRIARHWVYISLRMIEIWILILFQNLPFVCFECKCTVSRPPFGVCYFCAILTICLVLHVFFTLREHTYKLLSCDINAFTNVAYIISVSIYVSFGVKHKVLDTSVLYGHVSNLCIPTKLKYTKVIDRPLSYHECELTAKYKLVGVEGEHGFHT